MKHRERRAASPFGCVSCVELREMLAKEATDEQRLLELSSWNPHRDKRIVHVDVSPAFE